MNNQTDPAPMVTLFDPEFELKIEPLDIEIEDDRVNNVYVNCELEERSYIEETNLDENVEDPLAIDQEEIQASRSESNISSIKVIPIRKKSLPESFMEDENDQNGNEKALDDSDEYDITLNDSKDLKVDTFFTLFEILIYFTKKEKQLSKYFYYNIFCQGAVFELDKEDIYVVNSTFELGEYAWSKLGRWPYWPSIVCPDPDTKEFTTVKESKQFGNHRLFHVEFFGGKRAWVKQKHMLSFEGLEAFEELGNSMDKVKKADFFPTGYTLKLWLSAVEECLSALEKSEDKQIELSPNVSTFSHKNTSPRSNFDNRDTFPINQEIIDESLDEDNVDVETLSFENDPMIIDEQNDPTKIANVRKSKEKSSCDKCGKSFANKSTLKAHVDVVHEGKRSQKCEECNKIFTQKSDLKKHIKHVHRDIRDHKCDECNKAFHKKSHLNEHIKTVHRGIKTNQ